MKLFDLKGKTAFIPGGYGGIGAAITNATGTALVPMKRSSQAIISATFGTRVSNSATVSAAQSANDFTLTPCLVLAAPMPP